MKVDFVLVTFINKKGQLKYLGYRKIHQNKDGTEYVIIGDIKRSFIYKKSYVELITNKPKSYG